MAKTTTRKVPEGAPAPKVPAFHRYQFTAEDFAWVDAQVAAMRAGLIPPPPPETWLDDPDPIGSDWEWAEEPKGSEGGQ